ERRVLGNKNLSALGGLVFAVPDIVHVAHDLLDRVLSGRRIHEVVTLRLLELEDRNRVARFVITSEQNPLVVDQQIRAISIPTVEWKVGGNVGSEIQAFVYDPDIVIVKGRDIGIALAWKDDVVNHSFGGIRSRFICFKTLA